jgi:hypothetical protein
VLHRNPDPRLAVVERGARLGEPLPLLRCELDHCSRLPVDLAGNLAPGGIFDEAGGHQKNPASNRRRGYEKTKGHDGWPIDHGHLCTQEKLKANSTNQKDKTLPASA